MSVAIIEPIDQQHQIITVPPVERATIPFFPDLHAAYHAFQRDLAHKQETTQGTYFPALRQFLDYIRRPDGTHQIPVLPIVQEYSDHLLAGISPVTAGKHLAAVRKFLSILKDQLIDPHVSNEQYRYLNELRMSVQRGSEIKNPTRKYDSHISQILQHGVWLRADQINEMLALIDRTTIRGKRDYALLITGFYTGLRRAELQRLTLAHFDTSSVKTDRIIGLVGKRGNTDDIPCPKKVYEVISDYAAAYNAQFPDGDPRCITPDQPVWRTLNQYAKYRIMSQYGVSEIVERRYTDWRKSINADYTRRADPKPFTCHDMRRSCVLNNYLAGMPPDQIIRITRHKSLDMFMKYVGKLIDYDAINSVVYNYILN